jgi:crotonobetainyl-CoA:carnitine CoA-transferase CaiB-like acyl-CoA transferase
VVKIERIGRGDDARAWAPPYWGEESATFMAVNRNKRSLSVDLKDPEGRAVVERLLARADVFVQSLRAGAVEDLGLGWERARVLNPRLVYCSVTAFGTEGPLRDRPGYDPLMQAYGGIMSFTGHPGAAPARVPVSLVDMGTGCGRSPRSWARCASGIGRAAAPTSPPRSSTPRWRGPRSRPTSTSAPARCRPPRARALP